MIAKEGAFSGGREWARCAIAVILTHFAVTLVHGLTHGHLGIALSASQQIFVGLVITVAPLVAGYLLWKDKLRSGGTLLATSMAGAFVFGVFYHFIALGPDNMNHQFPLGLATWARLFDQTAIVIAGLEGFGSTLGLVLVLKFGGRATKG